MSTLLFSIANQSYLYIREDFSPWHLFHASKLFANLMTIVYCFVSYEKGTTSTPVKQGFKRPPPPPVSTILTESPSDTGDDFTVAGIEKLDSRIQEAAVEQLDISMSSLDLNVDVVDEDEFNNIQNSIIDWDDETWNPDKEAESVSSLEEDVTKEVDTDSDDSDDDDYVPRVCLRTGGSLTTNICLESLPVVSMEESVHDAVDPSHDSTSKEPPLPEAIKIIVDDDVIGHPASIVYHDCLRQLAEHIVLPMSKCTAKDPVTKQQCCAQAPFEICIKSRGTAAVVEWMCPQGHSVWRWSSQPMFKYGMLVGDFMLASNILLSGNNYAKISLLFKFMNMGMVERSNFFRIQDSFCVDSIKEFWNEKRAKVITQLQPKGPVVVLGDARMDSPGFCAQYCTYTAMDNSSKQIISMVSLDKRETQRNSVIMEKEGFVRTLETLRQELNVTEVCTDAHSQISALFTKGPFKDSGIHHSLDIWHGSKNLNKRLVAAGQQKGCSDLLTWSKDVCNHFWHCCKTTSCYEEFMDLWTGLLHHVTGEHEWALGACHHGPLEDSREKDWIQQGSLAHQRLREIILEARWLKNIVKYLRFRSTADLESFHNHILMYASKRFSFSPAVYEARTMLAGLDYNHHVHRPAKRNEDGSIQYGKLFNKRSKTWRLYSLKVDKDYSYIPDLQSAILRARLAAPRGMEKSRPLRPEDPRRLGVLSGVPAPTTQELLQKQVSRGLAQASPPTD
ncbi:uncharacterized protein LOC134067711 isoform X2 [Sardina pilchardus]|uniref:uncharacterized protein LOC134067711 isoform X2 n=1 Tax=Sardina pilchardus TaxID=27697 RepID=UPI002E11B245